MRIIITGALGYLGQHLCRALLPRQNVELHGTYRSPRQHSFSEALSLHQVDLSDLQSTIQLIKSVQPQKIYHLAGNIQAGRGNDSGHDISRRDNLQSTQNLYEACLLCEKLPIIVFAGTGAIYGQAEGVINETTPLRPLSTYAANKAAADTCGSFYWHKYDLPIIRARLFNFAGIGQGEETAISRFAHQLAQLEKENKQPAILTVGNLNAERDFLDVADLVQALTLLLEHGEPGEAYNVASGISYPMHWFLDRLIERVRIPIEVKVDPVLTRTSEASRLQIDVSKLKSRTGWQPTIPIESTLASILEACRSRLVSG